MVIVIKDYTWRQTDELIIINVPLKGANLKKGDIFTSDHYLKIHYPPFLFEVCLWQPVVEAESECTVGKEEAVFRLLKHKVEKWPSLTANLSRQEVIEVKTKAIEEVQAKAQNRKEQCSIKKSERQRAAVSEQIILQTKEQQMIDQRRQQEKEAALAQMGWGRTQSSVKIIELTEDKQEGNLLCKTEDKDIFKESKKDISLVPRPRETARIPVTFTPRVFPTPCRESKIAEEQEWLSKQAEARRKTGFVAEDLRPEEQDPVWLCDKAQSFYDVGNYLGAVSAYSHALTLNSHMYELYLGRAGAQLALGNHKQAVMNASQALDLLTPPVPQNVEARARCLFLRGSALASLGLKSEALGELKAAESLRPDCSDIHSAILQLEIDGTSNKTI